MTAKSDKATAIIVAGGAGARFGGDIPKQYTLVAGKPLLSWTISRFEQAESIDRIVIVVAEEFLLHVNNRIVNPGGFAKVLKIVPGGESRMGSVYRGILSLPISTRYVAIHDAVRPLIRPTEIDWVVAEAVRERAAILGRPVAETVKRVREGLILATLDRNNLFLAETPQAFQYDLIREAYKIGMEKKLQATDDSILVESLGFKVQLVQSGFPNPKVTKPEDLEFIKMMLAKEGNG